MVKKGMNFQHLKTFCTVLRERSMTAASQKLFLTQPAVSQQIRQLEEDVGIELLIRGVRQVRATPQGQLLYEYAQRILGLVDESRLAIQAMQAEVSGLLRVGTLNSIGLHLIGPVFGLFLKNNNKVRLQLKYGRGAEIVRMLERGEVDVALLPDTQKEYSMEPSDCEATPLFKEKMVLVTGVKDAKVPNSIDLNQYNLLPVISLANEYAGFENTLEKALKKRSMRVRPVFESSNVGTLKRVVEAKLGWGFLPEHSVIKQLNADRLRKIEVTDFEYEISMTIYVPKIQKVAMAVDVFMKALQQQL
ncbi:MAG: LysR family transcriptional regulator [Bdellovibrionales bacterium CG10_big_fil_rev_8_21_14_0_10_45_34]|nr:MAG: LysR family transcriptional regulator [Bdellovibrionales bacterium CG10_big_fil_rev_8_21_14_0_10_45_34]